MNRSKLRLASLCAALGTVSAAGAAPSLATAGASSVAATADEPARHVEVAVSGLAGLVNLGDNGDGSTPSGQGYGLALTAAFYPMRRLGVVADVWRQWTDFPECPQDGSCFTYLAETQTRFTAGVRFPFTRAVSLDLTGGATASETRYTDTLWSPVVMGTATWRIPLGPLDAALQARASTMSERGTQISTLTFGLGAAKSW